MMGAVEGRRCGNGGWGIEGRRLPGKESKEEALVCSSRRKRRWEGWGERVGQLGQNQEWLMWSRMAAGLWWLLLMEGVVVGGRGMAVERGGTRWVTELGFGRR